MTRAIDGEAAWASVFRQEAKWSPDRFSGLICPVNYRPKFKISAGDVVFCIGSCFARNVEEHLVYSGVNVLSCGMINPLPECGGRPNGVVNKFTTASMANEVEWLRQPPTFDASFFVETGEGWMDLHLSPTARAVSLSRAVERRRYITGEYFARLRRVTAVIVTLGLNEVWRDATTGLYLNAAPSRKAVKAHRGRFAVEIMSVAQNVDALERFRAGLRHIGSSAKLVVTVSPVPLKLTFSGQDAVQAVVQAKSILRAAADMFCAAHDDVDYFPSYEMVTMAPRALAFAADARHVADRAVAEVVAAFLRVHDLPVGAHNFNELGYLAANPDVEQAVRRGEFVCGFQHWQRHGKAEGRPLTPSTPTDLMIRGGAV